MTRFAFITFLTLVINESKAQSSTQCNCGALVDVDFKGKILLYDKPNGKLINSFQHDFENEDFIILTIDKDSLDFFHVTISKALTANSGKTGWIKKAKVIGTYARNYGQSDTLTLYTKPNIKSKVQSSIPGWTNDIYIIRKCFNNWAYVRIDYRGQLKEGWLQPDKQCNDPYTTCN